MPVGHWSDCAVYNAPALLPGRCECGGHSQDETGILPATAEEMRRVEREAVKLSQAIGSPLMDMVKRCGNRASRSGRT